MDYKDIKKLIDDMGNSNLDSLEIEFPEGIKISMTKNTGKEVVITTGVPNVIEGSAPMTPPAVRENKGTSYSIQTSLNSSLAEKGTNGTGTEDVICNIYDMASNCYERSTETCSDAGMPCAFRGGYYGNSFFCTSDRGGSYTTYSTIDYSFRPLLYL